MTVVLLANAMRKDAHLRARAHQSGEREDPLHTAMLKRRSEPSQRYIEGMRDLLRILFANGQAVANECMEEAYARAMGASTRFQDNGNGTQFH